MDTKAIAARLIELCRKNEFENAQAELYAENAVSIEQYPTPMFPKETHGKEAIAKKMETFNGLVEAYHETKISEPLIAGNSFAVVMTMDMTMKKEGRMNMSELCVYETKDGKIISESFHM